MQSRLWWGPSVVLFPLLAGRALAHGGSLRTAAGEPLTAPTWLVLLTGGAVLGSTAWVASLASGRRAGLALRERGVELHVPERADRALWALGSLVGLLALAVVLYAGFSGPVAQLRNAAILLVWVGWWAGLPIVASLVGNPWPALDPVRTLASVLPSAGVEYPDSAGAWPAVVGVLTIVWVAVVAPLATNARLLAVVVACYVVLSLLGAVAFGDAWFRHADPVSCVFRAYGRVGALSDGRLGLPGTDLLAERPAEPGAVALVVALLWGTTYDGLVGTELVAGLVPRVVALGLPPQAVYALFFLAGYAVYLGAFRLAVRGTRYAARMGTDGGNASVDAVARRFAPALLPVVAGYHLAHYLAYVVSLFPALAGASLVPWNPPPALVVSVPGWFAAVGPLAVLAGHLLAVWVVHAVASEHFSVRARTVREPGRYPLFAVVVAYTAVSLWVVTRPTVTPAYL